jgi:hypothetical protein
MTPMNASASNNNCAAKVVGGIAILGAFLIVVALVWAMRHYTRPEPLNANRAAERARALADLRASETEALKNPGWIDPAKGIVRLPVDLAVKMVVESWGADPAAARSNLIARVEKATYVAPPPPPKPSAFE